jgi:glyoxylase-like metal-dependent hydrolase (beta-lactamase superfamily II)
MADDVRLYMFECGTLKCHVENIKMNQGLGEEYEVPVPWFLVTHPRGNVVIDGGNAAECATDAHGHWGATADVYYPEMTPEQACVPALRNAGFDPAEVRYIVQSHLHLDHSGAIGHFPNARYVVQRRELTYAYTPDWFQQAAYIRLDFDRDVDWLYLDGYHDYQYDVHGDGVIRTLFTPGHAPGHMSLIVDLEREGPFLLTADACYTRDHYEDKALPGLVHSAAETAESVRRIHREVDRLGATVVTGHDPDDWPGWKKAPDYYS